MNNIMWWKKWFCSSNYVSKMKQYFAFITLIKKHLYEEELLWFSVQTPLHQTCTQMSPTPWSQGGPIWRACLCLCMFVWVIRYISPSGHLGPGLHLLQSISQMSCVLLTLLTALKMNSDNIFICRLDPESITPLEMKGKGDDGERLFWNYNLIIITSNFLNKETSSLGAQCTTHSTKCGKQSMHLCALL